MTLDAGNGGEQHRAVDGWFVRFRQWLVSFLDEAMPMPPGQRAERDWFEESGDERSRRRKLRLRLHMLEKRGKGGYR